MVIWVRPPPQHVDRMTGTGERTRERPTGNSGDLISPVGFRRTVGFMVERKAPTDAPKKHLFCELWQEGEAYGKTATPHPFPVLPDLSPFTLSLIRKQATPAAAERLERSD